MVSSPEVSSEEIPRKWAVLSRRSLECTPNKLSLYLLRVIYFSDAGDQNRFPTVLPLRSLGAFVDLAQDTRRVLAAANQPNAGANEADMKPTWGSTGVGCVYPGFCHSQYPYPDIAVLVLGSSAMGPANISPLGHSYQRQAASLEKSCCRGTLSESAL